MSSSLDNQSALGNGNGNGGRTNGQPFAFDINAMSSWPTPTPPTQDTSLDDLFAGYMNPNQNAEFPSSFAATPSISPIAHQTNNNFSSLNSGHFNSRPSKGSPGASLTSSIPSPSSQSTASSDPPVNTPKESLSTSGSPKSDPSHDSGHHDKTQCPKTKSELVQRIAEAGASPFAPLGLQKSTDAKAGSMITCAGTTKFPRTEKNDKNVEVLSAWRSITSNPRLKVCSRSVSKNRVVDIAIQDANIDINDLCTEFTSKAKCDGTKVVLEPQEVDNIIESLANKKQ
jgi:AP-1-like factor